MTAHEILQEPAADAPAHGAPGDDAAYSMFAVFRTSSSHPVVLDGRDVPAIVQELEDVAVSLSAEGVTVRGWYDVSGIHSDADLMVWLHGSEIEDLQWALRQLRRCALLRPLIRSWSVVGVDQAGAPALDSGEAGAWLTCAAARSVQDSTAAAETDEVTLRVFAAAALSDAQWLIAAEADDPTALIALLHSVHGTDATTSELSTVFTGRYVEPAEIVEVLQ